MSAMAMLSATVVWSVFVFLAGYSTHWYKSFPPPSEEAPQTPTTRQLLARHAPFHYHCREMVINCMCGARSTGGLESHAAHVLGVYMKETEGR